MPIIDSHPAPVPERESTVWKNAGNKPARFRIWLDVGRPARDGGTVPARYLDVVIPPGETETLPAVYDAAIQCVRDGLIQSGLAPALLNLSIPNPPALHPSLVVPERAPRGAQRRRV